MRRTAADPTDWGAQFSMSQGEVVEGATRHLHCSGQVAVRPDPDAPLGLAVVSPGDIRGQMAAALANVDAVLAEAAMDRSNVVHLRFFTTDIDGFLANYDVYAEWIGAAGIMPPQSLLGIDRLALPELLVEVEVGAAA